MTFIRPMTKKELVKKLFATRLCFWISSFVALVNVGLFIFFNKEKVGIIALFFLIVAMGLHNEERHTATRIELRGGL